MSCLNGRWWISDLNAANDPAAVDAMKTNLQILRAHGARVFVNEATGKISPFVDVTGFDLLDVPTRGPGAEQLSQQLRSPSELVLPGTLSYLIWGSPHACPSNQDSPWHAPGAKSNHEFKTKAFESMAYQCKGLICMVFPACYKEIEFWPRPPGDNRILYVSPIRFHQHRSKKSGSTEDIVGDKPERVAMLLPPRFSALVLKHTEPATNHLMFGSFWLDVVKNMGCTEHAVELGCSTASLSMELIYEFQFQQIGHTMML